MTSLKNAFRHHLQTAQARYNDNRPRAVIALERARRDVAISKARYPAPVRVSYRDESDGLRFVGRVSPNFRRGVFATPAAEGWLTDPSGDTSRDGDGLCYGVVYQLPGRKGHARFVAGYQFGGAEGGPTIDLTKVYTCDRCDSRWVYYGDTGDIDACRYAARAADAMAKKAAKSEREYQTAWRAGSDYAQESETIAEARQEVIEILAERRAVKGKGDYPALCAAIRAQVTTLLEVISESRAKRAKRADLIAGDADGLYFFAGDERLREAFCEGAGLDSFPAQRVNFRLTPQPLSCIFNSGDETKETNHGI